jgi:hypothetical protein
MILTNINILKVVHILTQLANKMVSESEDIEPEIANVISEKIWEIM